MKIIIEIETTELTMEDKRILSAIAQTKQILMDPQKLEDSPLVGEHKRKYIKRRGQLKTITEQMIRTHDGLTLKEMTQLSNYSEGAISSQLRLLVKNKQVEQSAHRPYIYYKKGENSDLKDALKNAQKVQVMG